MNLDAAARRACKWIRLIAPAVVMGAALVMLPAARAAEPLVILDSTPANGAVIPQTSAQLYAAPIKVSITTSGIPSNAYSMFMEISTQNVPGQDGTLADDYRLEYLAMTRSDANPDVYTGTVNYTPYKTPWASVPGTYFWQVATSYLDSMAVTHALQSPVFSIVVAAPPPAPVVTPVVTPVAPSGPDVAPVVSTPYRMTLADVAYDVPLVISNHDNAAGTPKRLCNRVTRLSFKCAVAWKDGPFQYAGTLLVTDKGSGQPRSTFVGGRAKLTCLRVLAATTPKQKGLGQIILQRCVRRWHW